jgi:hypothetical protein
VKAHPKFPQTSDTGIPIQKMKKKIKSIGEESFGNRKSRMGNKTERKVYIKDQHPSREEIA